MVKYFLHYYMVRNRAHFFTYKKYFIKTIQNFLFTFDDYFLFTNNIDLLLILITLKINNSYLTIQLLISFFLKCINFTLKEL